MKKNNKGFTLAELLIVVAIIGVLIAIAVPTFSTQLKNAKLAADVSNVRAAYSEAIATDLASGTPSYNITINEAVATNGSEVTWNSTNKQITVELETGYSKTIPTGDGVTVTVTQRS